MKNPYRKPPYCYPVRMDLGVELEACPHDVSDVALFNGMDPRNGKPRISREHCLWCEVARLKAAADMG